MTIIYDTLHEMHLGYSAIFICMGMGFLFLRGARREEIGPGYWSLSFFMNSLGFLFWSGIVPVAPWQYFLVGEIFHIAGFLLLISGAYRFSGYKYRLWNIPVVLLWLAMWSISILLVRKSPAFSMFMLKAVRAILFFAAGSIILSRKPKGTFFGQRVAGLSLIAWGLYILAFAFLQLKVMLNLAFGFLVGFQMLAALGMVAMLIDRIRLRVEEDEERIQKLEGLLPICSYCKNIRDKDNTWHSLEYFIEEHSEAEFSHGICPDCFRKFKPDR
ncbi:MAG TPA: hypothetical protein VMX33_04665 [bacterium]|nr:hypothetical protein [bacterium]